MSTDEAIRASDADREHAIGMLRDGYATGRLTLAEFDERTTAALTSRTWGELRRLTGDLPAPGQRVLPPPAPRQALGGTERLPAALADRGPGLTPILLIAVYWLTLTFTAHAAGLLIPVVFLLLMAVQTAGRVRCGLDNAAHPPPGQSRPSQRSEEGPSRPG
jgi:hypothetical protein